MGAPLAVNAVASATILTASAGYTTPLGTYVVFSGNGICPQGTTIGVTAFKITPTSPPQAAIAWCSGTGGPSAPAVSMTDAAGSNAVVWFINTLSFLVGFDGDTGAVLFSGGGNSNGLPAIQKFQTPIIVKGRLFIASGNKIFAYTPN
jgi:hypothetical protein